MSHEIAHALVLGSLQVARSLRGSRVFRMLRRGALCASACVPLDRNPGQDAVLDSSGSLPFGSGLSGEKLTGNKVQLKVSFCNLAGGKVRFTARGKTTGPFGGTFAASGTWAFSFGHPPGSSFRESFTITSGTSTISGTVRGSWSDVGPPAPPMGCSSFGPAGKENDLTYRAGSWGSGSATTTGIMTAGFSESLL
jgi:hypothetical protein